MYMYIIRCTNFERNLREFSYSCVRTVFDFTIQILVQRGMKYVYFNFMNFFFTFAHSSIDFGFIVQFPQQSLRKGDSGSSNIM